MPLLHVPFRGRANLRNHRKLAVFDGERAIVGGMNLADEYMGPTENPRRFKDLSVLVQGPSAARSMRFSAQLGVCERSGVSGVGARRAARRSNARGSERARLSDRYHLRGVADGHLQSRAALLARDPLLRARRRAGSSARDRRTTWRRRPRAGARALEPSAGRFGGGAVLARAGRCRRQSLPLPARHAAREGRFGRRRSAIVGSANFDMRSLFLDYEIALFFTASSEVVALASWFEAALAFASAGPPLAGPLRTELERAFRLLAPLI